MDVPILSPIQVEHFNTGRIPWNKGTKGLIKPNSGSFKKGNISPFHGTKGLLRGNGMKGKPMPEWWKAKLRKPKSISHPLSEETKEKLRVKAKLRVGELNSHWKGGIRAVQSARRRERLAANGGSHTNGEWETLKARCNWMCVNPVCHKQEPEIKLTKDHIVSLKDGGSDNIENIQPLCMRCNVKKHSKSIRYG